MRIDPKTPTISPVSSVKKTTAAAPVSSSAEEDGDAAAVVELSSAARSARVDASSGASPEKLARLRSAIEKGEYQPDLDVLAQRIVDDDFSGGFS